VRLDPLRDLLRPEATCWKKTRSSLSRGTGTEIPTAGVNGGRDKKVRKSRRGRTVDEEDGRGRKKKERTQGKESVQTESRLRKKPLKKERQRPATTTGRRGVSKLAKLGGKLWSEHAQKERKKLLRKSKPALSCNNATQNPQHKHPKQKKNKKKKKKKRKKTRKKQRKGIQALRRNVDEGGKTSI